MFFTLEDLGLSLATLLFIFLITAVLYARWNYGVLERLKGVPHVITPYFIGGSDPFFYKRVVCLEDQKRIEKFGPVFGMYHGREPQIFIADPDLIRQILVKDWEYFPDKRFLPLGNELFEQIMDQLPYKKWKIVRSKVGSVLATGKIKTMSTQMMETVRKWAKGFKDKAGNKETKFTPREAFNTLAADVLARCGFGTVIDAFQDPNSEFLRNVASLSYEDGNPDWMDSAITTFPFLSKLKPYFPENAMRFFESVLKDMLESRRKSGLRTIDFVGTMQEMLESLDTEQYKEAGISPITVMSQAVGFMQAGYETIAATLTCIIYRLAKNPEAQRKLLEEIDAFHAAHGEHIEHSHLPELQYLRAVMEETIRMNNPVVRIERVCKKEWEYGGLRVTPGITIIIPVYAVHYNEKYFPDPYTFKPERWLDREELAHPYANMNFGAGPHNCPGGRFAREEIQIAIATIMKDFMFVDSENAELKLRKGRVFLTNFEPFSVSMVPRRL